MKMHPCQAAHPVSDRIHWMERMAKQNQDIERKDIGPANQGSKSIRLILLIVSLGIDQVPSHTSSIGSVASPKVLGRTSILSISDMNRRQS